MYPQSHVIHTCVFKNIRCRYDFCIHVDIYNTLFLIFTISQSHIYTQIYIYIYIYTFSHIYIYTSQCHGEIWPDKDGAAGRCTLEKLGMAMFWKFSQLFYFPNQSDISGRFQTNNNIICFPQQVWCLTISGCEACGWASCSKGKGCGWGRTCGQGQGSFLVELVCQNMC